MSLAKQSIKDSFIYGVGLLFAKGASFFLLPFYTHIFKPSEYGVISLVLLITLVTRTIISFEISQAAVVFSSDKPEQKAGYISTAFWFTFFINLTFCMLAVFSFLSIGNIFFSEWTAKISYIGGLIILLALFMDSLYYFSLNVLRWEVLAIESNISMFVSGVSEVALVILLVSYTHSIYAVFLAWFIARSLGFIICYSFTRGFYSRVFDYHKLKEMLRFSTPLMIANVPLNLNAVIDRLIVASILGLTAAGIYSAAYMFVSVTVVLLSSVASAVSPMIYKEHHKTNSEREISHLFFLTLSVFLLLPIGMAIFNNEIVSLMLANEYSIYFQNTALIPLLLLFPIISQLRIFSPGFFSAKKTKPIIVIATFNLLLNLILNIVFISLLGILGAIIAILISSIISSLIYIIWAQRYYYVPFESKRISILFFVSILFFIASYILNKITLIWNLESFLLKLGFLSFTIYVYFCMFIKQKWMEIHV